MGEDTNRFFEEPRPLPLWGAESLGMKRVFADTGYWIALLTPQDALHKEAHRLFATLAGVKIVTSDWVLIELLDGFATKGPHLRSLASDAVAALKKKIGRAHV